MIAMEAGRPTEDADLQQRKASRLREGLLRFLREAAQAARGGGGTCVGDPSRRLARHSSHWIMFLTFAS